MPRWRLVKGVPQRNAKGPPTTITEPTSQTNVFYINAPGGQVTVIGNKMGSSPPAPTLAATTSPNQSSRLQQLLRAIAENVVVKLIIAAAKCMPGIH